MEGAVTAGLPPEKRFVPFVLLSAFYYRDVDLLRDILLILLSFNSVVFSAWTGMLNLIEKALSAQNIEFQRLDGTKTLDQQHDALQDFRNEGSYNVLLASLGSGAVG